MKVMGAPSRMVRTALTVGGPAAILVVGALDHWTGPEISFSLFYLVPIAAAAWFVGRRAGLLVSLCAGATWLAADLIPSHYSHPAIAYWNAMVRLVVFLAVSLLLSRLREMNLSLERKAQERAVALAAEKDGHEVTRDALRDSEERFRRLIESVKDYAIFMLDPSGHVMTWNEGARRLTGYEPQEILGRHYSVLLPPDQSDCRGAAEYLRTALTDGTYEGEGLRVRKDGRRFWAGAHVRPSPPGPRDKAVDACLGAGPPGGVQSAWNSREESLARGGGGSPPGRSSQGTVQDAGARSRAQADACARRDGHERTDTGASGRDSMPVRARLARG